ncbi:hypothetical protein OSTOST_20341, partial [Ostertagia ostertagi]
MVLVLVLDTDGNDMHRGLIGKCQNAAAEERMLAENNKCRLLTVDDKRTHNE